MLRIRNSFNNMEYSRRAQTEINNYKYVEDVHDLPSIYYYYENNFLKPKWQIFGFNNVNEFYIKYILHICKQYNYNNCEILSIGAGNCDTEIELAKLLIGEETTNFCFSCLDINPYMLERGKRSARDFGVNSKFNFIQEDINQFKEDKIFHVVIANQSLHHFLNLEDIFDKIYDILHEEGFFLTNDMIGRNGHMRWPQALELIEALWLLIDRRYKYEKASFNQESFVSQVFYEVSGCRRRGTVFIGDDEEFPYSKRPRGL